jgi:hypothetical protein
VDPRAGLVIHFSVFWLMTPLFWLENLPSFLRDSSVGIATRYRLDGPRIETRWGRDFLHPSRPALGPTQPPVQRVSGLSRG